MLKVKLTLEDMQIYASYLMRDKTGKPICRIYANAPNKEKLRYMFYSMRDSRKHMNTYT